VCSDSVRRLFIAGFGGAEGDLGLVYPGGIGWAGSAGFGEGILGRLAYGIGFLFGGEQGSGFVVAQLYLASGDSIQQHTRAAPLAIPEGLGYASLPMI